MKERWITIKEAAKLTGKSRSTIQNYIRIGILESKQVKELPKNYVNYYSIPTYLREEGKND